MSQDYKFDNRQNSIVLIGGFSNINFTHEKLFRLELISESDYNESKIIFMDQNQIYVSLPWAKIQLNPADKSSNKLTLTLTDEGSLTLFLDLVKSIIQLFYTSESSALGINFNYRIQHNNADKWHDFGHKIVPKPFWKDIFSHSEEEIYGTNNVALKITSVLESIKKTDDDMKVELNLNVRPLFLDENGTKLTNTTEIVLNYHFPLNKIDSMDMANNTIDTYFNMLNDTVDARVKQLLECE